MLRYYSASATRLRQRIREQGGCGRHRCCLARKPPFRRAAYSDCHPTARACLAAAPARCLSTWRHPHRLTLHPAAPCLCMASSFAVLPTFSAFRFFMPHCWYGALRTLHALRCTAAHWRAWRRYYAYRCRLACLVALAQVHTRFGKACTLVRTPLPRSDHYGWFRAGPGCATFVHRGDRRPANIVCAALLSFHYAWHVTFVS